MEEPDDQEIYMSLPGQPTTTTRMRMQILDYLKQTPNEWHTVKEIAKAIEFYEKDTTKPTIRMACRELLHINKQPIISCHAGFTFTTQRSMMRKFKDNIQSRVFGMERTIRDAQEVINLEKNWEN